MKKSLLFTALLAVMAVSSCDKEQETVKSPQTPNYVTKSGMSPGQLHNRIATDYMDQFGIEHRDQLSTADVRELLWGVAEVSKPYGVVPANANSAEIADMYLEKMTGRGMFSDGFLKSADKLNEMAISSIDNPEVKEAFSQVYERAKSEDPDFVANAKNILQKLENLSTEEQQRLDGAISVLENSYNLWEDKVSAQMLAIIVFSDFSYYYESGTIYIGNTRIDYVYESVTISLAVFMFF